MIEWEHRTERSVKVSQLDALNVATHRYLRQTVNIQMVSDEFRQTYRGVVFYDFKPSQISNMLIGQLVAWPHNPADSTLYIGITLAQEDLLLEPVHIYGLIESRIREALHRMNAMVEDPFTAWVREVREENGLE